MDATLKAKWVEALRSGKYEQGPHKLHNKDNNTYCCLGVLCVLAGKEPDAEEYKWLDRITNNYGPFVRMNDDEGKSFLEIAAHIEANIPAD